MKPSDGHPPAFEGWAIVELMGHRRLAGMVSEVEIAGQKMLRLDVPSVEAGKPTVATQFYSSSALYCLTPTTEELARKVAGLSQPQPVARWELPAPRTTDAEDADLDEDEEEADAVALVEKWLGRAAIWRCDQVATQELSAAQAEAMMREYRPDWFEPEGEAATLRRILAASGLGALVGGAHEDKSK